MSEPFIGEIRMFPYTFAPRDWAYCEGQLLEISQNTALFAILGIVYGGDGRVTVGLPDLKGRAPLHVGGANGKGPGLSYHGLGERSGEEGCTLTEQELPAHTHGLIASKNLGATNDPAGRVTGKHKDDRPGKMYYNLNESEQPNDPFNENAVGLAGSGNVEPHENRQPFLTVPFCIALYGIYPSRS